MGGRRSAGRWVAAALCAVTFAALFLVAFAVLLPGETLIGSVRTLLAARGIDFRAGSASLGLSPSVRFGQVTVGPTGRDGISLDRLEAAWDWGGILRGLPVRIRGARGEASFDLGLSARFWAPSRAVASLANVSGADLSPLLPPSEGVGFRIEEAAVRWSPGPKGGEATGGARLAFLRFPVPAKGSPVREAELRDLDLRLAFRDGTVLITSAEGSYEGARVEGAGEIAGVMDPPRATVSFHLRIVNPLEGKVAVLFDLASKNAKNATLRITGTLLNPSGEFRFF